MLKHAGERPQQHKQGFVQPEVCSLSLSSLSLAALLPAVKTAFLGEEGTERFDPAAVLYARTSSQRDRPAETLFEHFY